MWVTPLVEQSVVSWCVQQTLTHLGLPTTVTSFSRVDKRGDLGHSLLVSVLPLNLATRPFESYNSRFRLTVRLREKMRFAILAEFSKN